MNQGGRKRKCRECTETFEVQRDWQIFCAQPCRLRFNKRAKETCFYCGAAGQHRDHVFPKGQGGTRSFRSAEYVMACHECNSVLSNRILAIEDRFDFLISYYESKYKLKNPAIEWDDEEIEELGPALRKRVQKKLTTRRRAEERVIYLHYAGAAFKENESV